MSDLLKRAFDEATKLPKPDQDAFAAFLLAELEVARQWRARFAASPAALAKLASQARRAHEAGKTRPLDDLVQ